MATLHGFCSTVVGMDILLANLFTGTVFDLAHATEVVRNSWPGPTVPGGFCTFGLRGSQSNP